MLIDPDYTNPRTAQFQAENSKVEGARKSMRSRVHMSRKMGKERVMEFDFR